MTPSASEPGPGSALQRSMADAQQRIQGIIDAAEQAAHEIRADAERAADEFLREKRIEADHPVEDRQQALDELVRSLITRADGLKREAEQIAQDVEKAFSSLAPGDSGGSASPEAPAPVAGPRPIAYAGKGAQALAQEEAAGGEEAVLRATQLAVAGTDRETIEATLRREFDIDEPQALVDDILGPAAG